MCETQDSRSNHLICYPSSCYVFRGSGKRLRHIGVAVGSIEGAEGRRSTVRRFGERDKVWVCVASKHKAAEGVAMGQDHHGLHQLSQRPALLARLQQRLEGTETRAQGQRTMYNLKVFFSLHLHLCLCTFCDVWFICILLYLDVWAGSEPWLVGQHLVDVVEKTKARRCCLQTLQPQRVPTHPQKLGWVQVHQVVTVMACCSLDITRRANWTQIQQETLKLEILSMLIQEQHDYWPWWRCNGGNAVAGGRPCAGCSAVCAGSSPSTEGERPSAGTRRPRSPCWPEPSWTAATLAPSHRSPSPTETRTERSQKVGFWWPSWKVSTSTC